MLTRDAVSSIPLQCKYIKPLRGAFFIHESITGLHKTDADHALRGSSDAEVQMECPRLQAFKVLYTETYVGVHHIDSVLKSTASNCIQ